MPKFRKKPVVIEAVQFKESFDGSLPIKNFVGSALVRIGEDYNLAIRTLEGDMLISDGDWIIKGVNGEFYPCKNEIFEKTYEPVEEN